MLCNGCTRGVEGGSERLPQPCGPTRLSRRRGSTADQGKSRSRSHDHDIDRLKHGKHCHNNPPLFLSVPHHKRHGEPSAIRKIWLRVVKPWAWSLQHYRSGCTDSCLFCRPRSPAFACRGNSAMDPRERHARRRAIWNGVWLLLLHEGCGGKRISGICSRRLCLLSSAHTGFHQQESKDSSAATNALRDVRAEGRRMRGYNIGWWKIFCTSCTGRQGEALCTKSFIVCRSKPG